MVLPLAGQNLVYNGSFEQISSCPTSENQLYKATAWSSPNLGSPDLLCSCSTNSFASVPNNLFGYQSPVQGSCYAHFLVDKDYSHEYLTFMLKDILKSNSIYLLTFRVSLADNSGYCIDRIGCALTAEHPFFNTLGRINLEPTISSQKGLMLCDTSNWMVISDTIKATGTEKFLTIGQFFPADSLSLITIPNATLLWAYYFIDAVELIELVEEPYISIPNIFTPNNDGVNDLLPISISRAQSANTQIFNRWGSLVFESNDLNPAWDGTYNGNPVAAGVYFIVVNATGSGGAQTTETQTVHLIR